VDQHADRVPRPRRWLALGPPTRRRIDGRGPAHTREATPVMGDREPFDELAEGVVGHVTRAFCRHVRYRLTATLRRMSHQLIQIISAGGLPAVFAGRLLPVIRTYISFPAGLSRITVVPFTLATTLGAIPWNLALAYAGFTLGQNYERVAAALGPFTIPIAILVLLAIVAAYYY